MKKGKFNDQKEMSDKEYSKIEKKTMNECKEFDDEYYDDDDLDDDEDESEDEFDDDEFEDEDEFEEQDEEEENDVESKNEKKKMKKENKRKRYLAQLNGVESTSKFNPLEKLNKMETKSNVGNSMIKTLVDTVACLLIAPTISAITGKFAPLVGGAINFSGHYMGDQSGLMRAVGIGTMVHGMAKVNEYRSEDSTVKSRFNGIQDDWLKCFLNKEPESKKKELLDAETKPKAIEPIEDKKQVADVSVRDVKNVDLSSLDFFDNDNSKGTKVEKEQNNTSKDSVSKDSINTTDKAFDSLGSTQTTADKNDDFDPYYLDLYDNIKFDDDELDYSLL